MPRITMKNLNETEAAIQQEMEKVRAKYAARQAKLEADRDRQNGALVRLAGADRVMSPEALLGALLDIAAKAKSSVRQIEAWGRLAEQFRDERKPKPRAADGDAADQPAASAGDSGHQPGEQEPSAGDVASAA